MCSVSSGDCSDRVAGASRGVLLTTSTFTRDATEAAARALGRIVREDDARLASLMFAHGVGVIPLGALRAEARE